MEKFRGKIIKTALLVSGCTLALTAAGCAVAGKVISEAGKTTGYLSETQASSIERSSTAIDKSFEDITPEQEYYIGRAVAATVLSTYRPFDNKEMNRYLNLVGQSLAAFSDRPEIFGGYHFLLLDSDEINAFAAPGGLVLVSRGMVRCCTSEDALAAVLAHEIGHVEKRHGLKAIKKARLNSALTVLAVEGAKNVGGDRLARLTADFEGSITDITSTMMNSGYARDLEREADRAAVGIMKKAGYDPAALIGMLERMKAAGKPGRGFAKTHPDPKDRIKTVSPLVGAAAAAPAQVRIDRFTEEIGKI